MNELEKKVLDITPANVFNSNNLEVLLNFSATIVKSNLTPHKTPESALAAILQGMEIGLPAMAALNNIHLIQGRATLGVNVYTAILLKNGIIFDILKDCQPIFQYVRRKSDGKDYSPVIVYREDELPDVSQLGGDKLVKGLKPADYVTEIKFSRIVKGREFTIINKFSYQDAITQGLTEKDNWVRMLKTMLRTRCLTTGARLIAPDLFMGLYETTEILDTNQKNNSYAVTEDGIVEDLTNNG